jgi:Type I phosphodiesterase / nucleotide pyrophosphatase
MKSTLVALVALTLLSCQPAAPPPPAAPPHPAPAPARAESRPPVVVTLVVDQLAAWIASERLPLLPRDGGFARLLAEGTYVRDARYAHACTLTAPGHAALYTGAPPRESGVTANERVDPESRQRVSFLRDPATRLVAPSGKTDAIGASGAALHAPTLADALRVTAPDAFIVSVSLKDRGAIPGGGLHPTATIWFDTKRDEFVTSTAFAEALPAWALPVASHEAVLDARKTPWVPLDPPWLAAHAATSDDQPGEGAWPGQTSTFPHAFQTATSPARAFRASPAADAAVLALARAAIRSEAFGRSPTLLALSLSSTDYVGHVYGPDSWEAWDNLLALDRGLAELFRELDARRGPDGYAVVLSADHGVAPMPETAGSTKARPYCRAGAADRWARPCVQGSRVLLGELNAALDRVAEGVLGQGVWVLGVTEPYVVLSDAARSLPAERLDALIRALMADLGRRPELARVIDVRSLKDTCPPSSDESEDALVCRAFTRGAGEIYLLARSGSFFDAEYTPGHGSSHGTPYVYDRAIPILARAPGKIAKGRTLEGPLSFATFTRTAAALLGVAPPAHAAEGGDLTSPADTTVDTRVRDAADRGAEIAQDLARRTGRRQPRPLPHGRL